MAKLKKTNALLAILFVLVGVGVFSVKELKAAGALEWEKASISSAAMSVEPINPCDGQCIAVGILISSNLANTGGWVALRDTDTATASDGGPGGLFSPFVVVSASMTISAKGNFSQPLPVMFDGGIRAYRGISANAAGCPTASTANCYTVLFKRVSD